MPSFRDSIIRLYRTLFTDQGANSALQQGPSLFLDGNSAVAVCEAAISGYAALGSSYLASGAEIVWRAEEAHPGKTLLGTPLHHHSTEGARGALAAAMGLTMAGERATLFMSGRDLMDAESLLGNAVARHLPLVLHVTSEAQAQHGAVLGGSDEALYSAANSGAITLQASTVQQAIDLTLIGRRISEQTLTPTVIFMDAEAVAHSGQQVTLPSQELVEQFVGSAGEAIPAPNAAQRMIFGDERPRVPSWHDLNRPVLHGALQSAETFALGQVGQDLFFAQELSAALTNCYQEFTQLSGRDYSECQSTNAEKAEWLVVTHAGIASQLEHHIKAWRKQKVGVVTLTQLAPLPVEGLRQLLSAKKGLLVLEQQGTPSHHVTPLMKQLQSLAGDGFTLPPVQPLIYGLGGMPLNGSDLRYAILQWQQGSLSSPCYLGLQTTSNDSRYPKRQVLLDSLKRDYPQLAGLGLNGSSADNLDQIVPPQQFRLTLHRMADDQRSGLIADIGNLLHHILDGSDENQIRTQSDIGWESWGEHVVDMLSLGATPLCMDPQLPSDLAVVTNPECLNSALATVKTGGVVLVAFYLEGLSSHQQRQLQNRQLKLFWAAGNPNTLGDEALLGALFSLLGATTERDIKLRHLSKARAPHHAHLSITQQRQYEAELQQGFNETSEADMAVLGLIEPVAAPDIPMAVRHLRDNGTRYDSLPRFWDQVGTLYREECQESLGADPYITTGTVPPLTATFNSHLTLGRSQPKFEAQSCSGCGLCWANCPDSAIGASALSPKLWLDGMFQQGGIDALRPIASKISSQMSALATTLVREEQPQPQTMGGLFQDALATVMEKGGISGDRRDTILEVSDRIVQSASQLDIAITEPLFRQGEAKQQGGGALLSLVINPDSCKGCGICSELCEAEALPMGPLEAEEVRRRRQQWQNWEQLPDTPSTTIERIAGSELDAVAARMLSRHCAFSMAGGDGAESGSGTKMALRSVLAATEYHQQPLISQLAEQVGELHRRITARYRITISIPSLTS